MHENEKKNVSFSMMKKYVFIIVSFMYIACAKEPRNTSKSAASTPISEQTTNISTNANVLDSLKLGINFKPKGKYTTLQQMIQHDREYFARQLLRNREKALDSASNYIYDKLINELVPHWYGTPWDFNGHTNIPNNGEIACGYFVSTTLKHLGFQLNRYKMAQQAGMNEAITLQPRDELKIYRNISQSELKEKLNKVYTDGIYFVGLSNHVGYMLIKNKELYFLHSSYYDNKVMIEKAEISPCFQSDIYVFAEITTNRSLIEKWIQKTPIPIHK